MPRCSITAIAHFQYVLVLNPMMSNAENGKEFGPFETIEELKSFYKNELTDPYSDTGPNLFEGGGGKTYLKSFRKGGPLEWLNPLNDINPIEDERWGQPDCFGHGIHEVITSIENVERVK